MTALLALLAITSPIAALLALAWRDEHHPGGFASWLLDHADGLFS